MAGFAGASATEWCRLWRVKVTFCLWSLSGGGVWGSPFPLDMCVKTRTACLTLSLSYCRPLCCIMTVFSGLAGGEGVVWGQSAHKSPSFVGVFNFGGR